MRLKNRIFDERPHNTTKRLFLGECKLLRAHLQNIPVGITAIEESPAVAALGYTAHSLMTMRPWLVFTQPERTIPTGGGVWAEVFGSWDDRAPWDEEGDEIDQGSGDLVPTVERSLFGVAVDFRYPVLICILTTILADGLNFIYHNI